MQSEVTDKLDRFGQCKAERRILERRLEKEVITYAMSSKHSFYGECRLDVGGCQKRRVKTLLRGVLSSCSASTGSSIPSYKCLVL